MTTTNLTEKRAAIMWKIRAVAACQNAIFEAPPIPAFIDLATLGVQMNEFFETGAGKELFGERQQTAIDATRAIRMEMERLVRDALTEKQYSDAQADILAFARENPITDFARLETQSRLMSAAERTCSFELANLVYRGTIENREVPP